MASDAARHRETLTRLSYIWRLVLVFIATVSAVAAVMYQFMDSRRMALESQEQLEKVVITQRNISELNHLIEEKVQVHIKNLSTPEVSALPINEKINELDNKISKVSEQTLALRQALNPIKPDEVITIARLTDQVLILKRDVTDSVEQIKQNQKDFKESVLRELKSSNDSTNLILVVLIPLVLNFLYTV